MNRRVAFGVLFLATLATPSAAWAEGSAQLGTTQRLQAVSIVYAEVASTTETICWTGTGSVQVFSPNNALLATLLTGQCTSTVMTGWHRFAMTANQVADWDFSVRSGGVPIPGRVFSGAWNFDAASFAEANATDGSFYALLPGGAPGTDTVVELKLDGLAGFIYVIGANETGVDGPDAGRSVPTTGNSATPTLPLYLNPPDLAAYNPLTPVITNFAYSGGATDCNELSPGLTSGTFTFDSNVEGTFHLECDLDGDGIFDIVDPNDLLIIGNATLGSNSVQWDGTDNSGNDVPPGSYDCHIALNVGEFHYVGADMETSYPGLRLFEVAGTLARSPLRMFWNDTLVQANEGLMPNGDVSPATSPPGGLDSGPYAVAASPHGTTNPGNARAWGNFNLAGTSKGNNAYLDTFSVARQDISSVITVVVVDAAADTDGEGVVDVIEDCTLGTDSSLPDSDGDGIDDFVESDGGSPVDTDGDSTIDALDDDSDDDGVADSVEGAGDTDGDGDGDYRDDDSDNDGVVDGADTARTDPDVCADADSDGCDDCSVGTDDFGPLADNAPNDDGLDTDGDGQCDAGDPDKDNDGVLDGDDAAATDPDICEDSDGDGCDDCAVGTDDLGPLADNDPTDDGPDADADGICNDGDDDDDNDGVLDGDDTAPNNPQICEDSDGDGCDDCAVGDDGFGPNADNDPADDGPDADADGICDDGDPDDDGDGVDDGDDSDPLDPNACSDTDGDSCDDCSQTQMQTPDDDGPDRDGDGICDEGESLDSDGDSVPDSTDNCRNDANTDQADRDNNGIGDVCESPSYNGGDTQQEGACSCSLPGERRGGAGLVALLAAIGLAFARSGSRKRR